MARPRVAPRYYSSVPRRHAEIGACAAAAVLLAAAPALAWDSKGHNVIEALAYRTLVEGRGDQPPRPDVLRDLINDGALTAPFCFGRGNVPPGACIGAAEGNPLLSWPQPRTDRPDAAFRRQFSDPGQCFHFMATLADAETERLSGSPIPRGLATSAVVRCRNLLDNLLRQIVIAGGPGTRQSGYGLYELAHAVADSFSGAHTERDPGDGKVDYLRVWKPIEKLANLPTERARRIPNDVYHVWNDHRDKAYVGDRVVAGQRCEERTPFPYDVPFECLSEPGDLSRQALVELYILVRDLRMAQKTAPAPGEPEPERSAAWTEYKEKWFTSMHHCRGTECDALQPVEKTAGGYTLIGIQAAYNATTSFTDLSVWGEHLSFSQALNPFVYALGAQVGYRRLPGGEGVGVAGLDFSLILPVGKRAAVGFAPMIWLATFGSGATGPELRTQFFLAEYQLGERTWLSLLGPLQVNWLVPRIEWAFGARLGIAVGSAMVAGGPIIRHFGESADRHDDAWIPPPAPYGRLKGRRASVYVVSGITTVTKPEDAVEGHRYGLGTLGAELMWDRDRWEGRYVWVPGVSLSVGARSLSGTAGYLTGIVSASLRWYVLGPLGLSFTPVRVEGGPKVVGRTYTDASPDVHGEGRGQYYLQAGSRLGFAFNAGIVDLLVEGPTLAWRSDPFNTGEILSARLGIRLN